MSSSEDEIPLAARRSRKSNGRAVLPEKIDPSVDRRMEDEAMEIDAAHAPGVAIPPAKATKILNGTSGKRKAAQKPTIKDESDSEDEPLVGVRPDSRVLYNGGFFFFFFLV